jgi:hypothetical protein
VRSINGHYWNTCIGLADAPAAFHYDQFAPDVVVQEGPFVINLLQVVLFQ